MKNDGLIEILKKDRINDVYLTKSFFSLGRSISHCYNCSYCRANDSEKYDFIKLPGEIREDFKNLPVAVNLFYGDPFIQTEHTYNLLRRLEANGHKGIVVIITKGVIPEDFPKFNLDIHFGCSTFGIDSKYDGSSFSRFQKNLETASKLGYKFSIEYRPIICNVNDSDECFERVVREAAKYNIGIGYCGLQMSDNLRRRLKEDSIEFEQYPGLEFGMKKVLLDEVHERLRKIAGEYGVRVFKKTSCLLTWSHSLERDINAHYYRPGDVGCSGCPIEEKCRQFKEMNQTLNVQIPFEHELLFKQDHKCELLKNGLCKFPSYDCLHIKGTLIKIKEPVSTSDVRLIKWLTGFTVDAEFRECPYISEKWSEK